MAGLSKSRIMSSLQCLKRVHLEIHRKDLHPVTKANYYHPDMLGSWSIKAVLPTIAPEMDYELLDGINVGTEASSAYLEAINPETSEERREEIRVDMLRYCKHDTAAMLKLVQIVTSLFKIDAS